MNPDPDLTHALGPVTANQDTRSFEPDLDAALAAAFGPDPTPGGWSQPPLLRDDPSDHAPIIHPNSPAMPRGGDRYQMLGEIARGGMGVILKGRDPDLGRDLAFKVLKTEFTGRPVAEQRFVEEAQVGGQLQHPGIVPVYELGRFADGRPYFTMKLVRGRTLAALLADRASPDTNRGRFLKVFEQVSQTVAYAHSKGVIHRDLKPSNVMVGSFGEVQVMDWGLAKVLHDGGIADEAQANSTNLDVRPRGADEPSAIQTARSGPGSESDTIAGSVLGTPAFMPPEQAGGEIDKLDERADVYGLGAVLCVILTGQPPHVGDDVEIVRRLAIGGVLDGAFARLDNCGADVELVSLCKRCLAPEREDRPRDASEVEAAVTAYLQSVEDRAHRAEVERAEAEVRAAEQRKRRRVQAAFGMTLTVAVGLVGFGLWWQERQQSAAAADRASRQSRTAASVAIAVEDATGRIAEAWKLADEPDKMRTATDLALGGVRRAEGFANTGDPTPETLAELTAARGAVDELDRHTRLFVACDLALRAHDVGTKGEVDGARTTARMADAFREFGWDPIRTPAEKIAGDIAASRVRHKILGFLCDWEFQSSQDIAAQQQVRAVVRLVRLKCGGLLAQWQEVMDSDRSGLADFSAHPDVATLGPELLCALGRDLKYAGKMDALLALMRRAAERYPTHVWVNFDLMHVCREVYPPRTIEALRFAAAAVAARPDSALLQVNLGASLLSLGVTDQAIVVYRRAIALAPTYEGAYSGLAAALTRIGDHAGAAATYRELIREQPKLWRAHANAGLSLYYAGDFPGAVAAYKVATQLNPNNGGLHYSLAASYRALGAIEDSLEALRKAIELEPRNSAYSSALDATARDGALLRRLPAIKNAADNPVSPGEALRLAEICARDQVKEYAVAFWLYSEAFAGNPSLLQPIGMHRYSAARAALQLAAGEDGEAVIGIEEWYYLQKMAREWLAAELAALRNGLRSATPTVAQQAAARLYLLSTDPALASVRDRTWLAAMPVDEYSAWEAFWSNVESARKIAKALPNPMLQK